MQLRLFPSFFWIRFNNFSFAQCFSSLHASGTGGVKEYKYVDVASSANRLYSVMATTTVVFAVVHMHHIELNMFTFPIRLWRRRSFFSIYFFVFHFSIRI